MFEDMVRDGRNRVGGIYELAEGIYTQEMKLLEIDEQLSQTEEALSRYGAELDKEVAFDQTLKNEEQRKARRQELRNGDVNYLRIAEQLKSLQRDKKVAQIDMNRLRNLFTVEKLRFQLNLAEIQNYASLQLPRLLTQEQIEEIENDIANATGS